MKRSSYFLVNVSDVFQFLLILTSIIVLFHNMLIATKRLMHFGVSCIHKLQKLVRNFKHTSAVISQLKCNDGLMTTRTSSTCYGL